MIQFFNDNLLSLLIFSPILGVILLPFCRVGSVITPRVIAILAALFSLGLSLCLLLRFGVNLSGFQFQEQRQWLPSLGAKYHLGVDGLSVSLLVLTTFLTLLVIIASKSIHEKCAAYLGCVLFLETGMLGALVALDGLLFYVFWELMLIPMYFLIGVWGGKRKIYAALKFVLYTALGSLLMLVSIVYLAYMASEQLGYFSFALSDWMRLEFANSNEELLLYCAFALAFAIKIPLFPFHTWLPDAHVEAPTGGSVILAGVMLKMGLYGLIRFGVTVFPHATVVASPIFAILGVVGIVFGALVAWMQDDMKKLVAYSSVSHLGFCVLGFAALSTEGLQGCMLQMINHGISTGALFFLVGVLYDRKHTRAIVDYGGLAAKVPLFAFVFLVITLSSIGLPLTNGFIGEFLILLSSFDYSLPLAVFAVSGVILGAMYMLSLYRRVIFGPMDQEKNGDLTDLVFTEKMVFAPLLVAVFVIGLYPQPILRLTESSSLDVTNRVARFLPLRSAPGSEIFQEIYARTIDDAAREEIR